MPPPHLSPLQFTTAQSDSDLSGILVLQQANLWQNLPESEMSTQGFVTVCHSFETLAALNKQEQHLIVKAGDQVVGYILAMTKSCRLLVPVLVPMFDLFEKILYQGKLVASLNYLVVGQVCLHRDFRGLGVFDKSYAAYKKLFQHTYDFALTEIATTNQRSLNAHKRVGFEEIHRYSDASRVEWSIVIWDWHRKKATD